MASPAGEERGCGSPKARPPSSQPRGSGQEVPAPSDVGMSSQAPSLGSHCSCRGGAMSSLDRVEDPQPLQRHLQAVGARGHSPGPQNPHAPCPAPESLSLVKALALGPCSRTHPNAVLSPVDLSLTFTRAGEARSPGWVERTCAPIRKGWRSWAPGSQLGEGKKKDARAREEASSRDPLTPAHCLSSWTSCPCFVPGLSLSRASGSGSGKDSVWSPRGYHWSPLLESQVSGRLI